MHLKEEKWTSYSVLGCKIDLYFYDYKLAIENDEKGHKYRDIKHEIKRHKAIEKELDCKFIEINPEKESFNISKPINEVHRHITSQLKSLYLTRFQKYYSN